MTYICVIVDAKTHAWINASYTHRTIGTTKTEKGDEQKP